MENILIRGATIKDIPFLVQAIIEAEKSGTDKLSYSTIFGLSEPDVHRILTKVLLEEVDNCELSVSSFMIVEAKGKIISCLSSWIESRDGTPSSVIKGNLLNYTLPHWCIENAIKVNDIIRDLNIEYIPNTIVIGVGYVNPDNRGSGLGPLLITKQIETLSKATPDISDAYVAIFESNIPSIRSVEKLGFEIIKKVESSNDEILKYLPFNKKVLMRKIIK